MASKNNSSALQTDGAEQVLAISSVHGAGPLRVQAAPAGRYQLTLDGLPYTGQSAHRGQSLRWQRRGKTLELWLGDRPEPVLEVADFFVQDPEAARADAADQAEQTEHRAARETDGVAQTGAMAVPIAPEALFGPNTTSLVASAASGPEAGGRWGTLVAQSPAAELAPERPSATPVPETGAAENNSGLGGGIAALLGLGVAGAWIGNAGRGDTQAPTVTVTDNASGTASGPVTYTIVFSEPVRGFNASKISVTGGTANGFTDAGDGQTFSITVTPPAGSPGGTLQLSINTAGVTDAAGNSAVAPVVPAQAYVQTLVGGQFLAGPVVAGHQLSVQAYRLDGQTVGAAVRIADDGTYQINLGGYSGGIVLRVLDQGAGDDFVDEGTAQNKDLNAALMAASVLQSGSNTVNINPVTTVAAVRLGLDPNPAVPVNAVSLQNQDIEAGNATVATAFGLSGRLVEVTPIPVINSDRSDNSANANPLGKLIAALSGMDENNGGDMVATLEALANGIEVRSNVPVLGSAAAALLQAGAQAADVQIAALPLPLFNSASTVSMAENAATSTVVYQASTTASQAVTYSLKPGADAALLDIDSTTGAVTLKASADYETKSSYGFTVVATTAGSSGSRATEQTVTLNVTDVNDNAPVLTVDSPTVSLVENAAAGVIANADADATDADATAANNTVTFSLVNAPVDGSNNALFEINSSTGEISLTAAGAAAIDYESATKSYTLTVKASDGLAGHDQTQTVTINLTDVNDNAPVLTVDNATVSLAENAAGGVIAGADADATDADATAPNNTVTFSLVNAPVDGSNNALFEINSSTGEISLTAAGAAAIDYESSTKSYTLTVKASDGLAGHDQTQTVTINLTGVNEVPTAIALSANTIAENVTVGTGVEIGTLTVTDPDASGNNNVLSLSGTDAGSFAIVDGKLMFTGTSPDFEAKPSYSVTVTSTDGTLVKSQAFTINVTGVNEVPTAIALSANTIAENVTVGTGVEIGTLTVTDPDASGNNNVLSLSGTDAGSFAIVDGKLMFTGTSPDFEAKPSYSVTVTSTDGTLVKSQAFTINVTGVNEVPTAIALSANTIAENVTVGTGVEIGTLTVTDPDASGNNNVLSLSGTDAGSFAIVDGKLMFTGTSPDFEAKPSYSVTVTSTDGTLVKSQAFTINVTDVDDTAPVVTAGIAANTNDDTPAVTISATDTQSALNDGSLRIDVDLNNDGDFTDANEANYASGTLTNGSATVDLSTLAQGTYGLRARVTDAAGNEGVSGVQNFTVDLTPPPTPLATLINDTGVADDRITTDPRIRIDGLEAGATWQYELNGSGNWIAGAGSSIAATAFASPGAYDLRVRQTDPAGNTSTSPVLSFTYLLAPSETASITAVTDDAGSVTGPLASLQSTDDTALVLSGSVSADLSATSRSVAVYSGSTRLGWATVDNSTQSWSYTTPTLSSGVRSLSVRVEDTATGLGGLASAPFVVNVLPQIALTAVSDTAGASIGSVASGGVTDDTRPTLTGTVSAPLLAGEKVAVYDGTNRLGEATVVGTQWSFRPAAALADGGYSLTAAVESASGAVLIRSAAHTLTVDTATPAQTATLGSVNDDVSTNGSITGALGTGASTDDTTPTLSGTISAALTGSQVVAIYSTVGAVTTRLGTATVSGSNWTFTPLSALTSGSHSFTAVVETPAGTQGTASGPFVAHIRNLATFSVLDDQGTIQGQLAAGAATDDARPTFSGTLALPLGTNEELAIYGTVGGVTTRLGAATLDGLNWSFTPGGNLGAGTYSLRTVVQAAGNTDITAGRVISATQTFTLDTATPTQTASITGVTDNVNATTSNTATVANGGSADGTVHTLTGSVGSALGDSQVVAIYDTFNGVFTRLGTATMTSATAWTFTTGTQSRGQHSYQAVVENAATGAQGALSSAFVAHINAVSTPTVLDDVGPLQGAVSSGGFTDDLRPTLTGTLSAPLGTNEVLNIWNNNLTMLGRATVDGLNWTFTPSTDLVAGTTYGFRAVVQASTATIFTNGNARVTTAPLNITITSGATPAQTVTSMAARDNESINGSVGTVGTPVDITSGTSTDDTTPALSGTLSGSLSTGQVLAIYDTVGGVKTRLGTATMSGSNWTYAPTALSSGSHSFTARVENLANLNGTQGEESTALVVHVRALAAFNVLDNVGAVQGNLAANAATDDVRPTLSGTLSLPLGNGEELAIYDTVAGVSSLLGVATLDGLNWSFTPGSDLASGSHSLQAVIQAQGVTAIASGRVISAAQAFTVNAPTPTVTLLNVFDDVGTVQDNLAAHGGTDDAQPTVRGTVSQALGAGQAVAIYNTVGGVSTRIGAAVVHPDLSWTFTPGSDLAPGTYSLSAVIQPETAGSNISAGLAVSAARTVVLDSGTPTQTAAIARLVDDAATNGSGSAAVLAGTSTDDTTPTLSGTISAALTGAQVVAIYDTVDGVTTRLGTASVSGTTWVFTPGAALGVGSHSFTAVVENPATGAQGTASGAFVANIHSLQGITFTDDAGASALSSGFRYVMLQLERTLVDYWSVDELEVHVDGVNLARGAPVTVGPQGFYSSEEGLTQLVNGTRWAGGYTSFVPSGPGVTGWLQLDLGAHYAVDRVVVTGVPIRLDGTSVFISAQDMSATPLSDLRLGVSGAQLLGETGTLTSNTVFSYVPPRPVLRDDTPTLSGTLRVPLGVGEEVAVYNGSTHLGVATVNGLSWSFTPSTPLQTGSLSLQAAIQPAGATDITAARVLTEVKSLVVDARTPTQTADITRVTDDVGTNGSRTGTLADGTGTDDTTPTLSGTISAPLSGGQVVAIYDTVGGVSTKLGNATVNGTTWTYTTPTLATGSHSLKAVVENPATGTQGTASAEFVAHIHGAPTISLSDDVDTPAAATAYRYVMLQLDRADTSFGFWSVRELEVISGGTNVALGKSVLAGPQGYFSVAESLLQLVDGTGAQYTYRGGSHTTTGWLQLDLGAHYTIDRVSISGNSRLSGTEVFVSAQDMSTSSLAALRGGAAGAQRIGSTGTVTALTTFDFVPPSTQFTDDPTPTLSGRLTASLLQGEELAIYDTVGGVSSRIGAATVNPDLSWSFTPGTALGAGSHSLRAVVQTGTASDLAAGRVVGSALNVLVDASAPSQTQTVSISGATDNLSLAGSVGRVSAPVTVAPGASTDDATPTLSGTLSTMLSGAQVVAIYDTVDSVATRLGTASVSGNTWTFAVPDALAAGTHSFTARVENPATGAQTADSNAYSLNIHQPLRIDEVNDNAGSTTVNVAPMARYIMLQLDRATPGYWAFADVQVMAGGVNVAQGKPVLVGPQGMHGADSRFASWLVDGQGLNNVGTVSTNQRAVFGFGDASMENSLGGITSGWVQIDLGAAYAIDQIVLSPVGPNGLEGPASLSGTVVFASTTSMAGSSLGDLRAGAGGAVFIGATGTVANTSRSDISFTPAVATDDPTPTLSGRLSAALDADDEELAVYVNGVRSGTAPVLTGEEWSWTPGSALADGTHQVVVVVQAVGNNILGQARVASAAETLHIDTQASVTRTVTITSLSDDVSASGSYSGVLAAGASTDDSTPLISGTVSGPLAAGNVIAVYDGSTRLGQTTPVAGSNTWSLQLMGPLSSGQRSLTARVESPATGQNGADSTAAMVYVQAAPMIGSVNDNAGALQGELGQLPQASSVRYVRIDAANMELQLSEVEVWAWVNGVRTNLALDSTVSSRHAGGALAPLKDGDLATTYSSADFAPALQRSGLYANDWVMLDLGAQYVIDAVVVRTPNAHNVVVSASANDLSSFMGSSQLATAPGVTQVTQQTLRGRGGDWTSAQTLVTDVGTPTVTGRLAAALQVGEELAIFVGGNRLGAATVAGDGVSWSFTPDTALTEGSWSVQARVIDGQGRVVTASESLTLQVNGGATPSTQVLINGFADDVGSATGSFTTAVASTDDRTPTLSGTLNAMLKTGEVLGVYDTVAGTTVRLGQASVSGMAWTFTPSSDLALGAHSLTARVENTATGSLGTASTAFGLTVQSLDFTGMADNVGGTQGNLLAGAALDAARYVRIQRDSGLLDVAEVQVWVRDASGNLVNVAQGKSVLASLPGVSGSAGDKAVDGDAATGYRQDLLPQAAFTGNGFNAQNWLQVDLGQAYAIDRIVLVPLAGQADRLAGVTVAASREDMQALNNAQVSASTSIVRQTTSTNTTPAAQGVVLTGWSQSFASDDSTPVLTGTLGTALGTGEQLAVYANGVFVGLATVTTASGTTTWSYDFAASGKSLSAGTHSLRVQVQDALGNARLSATETLVVDDRAAQSYGFKVLSTTLTDDVGATQGLMAASGATDDRNPTVNITLNAPLDTVHRVAVYDGSTFLGYASGSGTTYSFTPVAALSHGAHSLQARIVNPVTGAEVHAGASQTLLVQAIGFTEVVDDAGLLTGNALDRSWSHGRDALTGNQGSIFAAAGGTTVLDDSLPLVKGTLGVALGSGQALELYLGSTRLGQATVSGTSWEYQLAAGQELPTGTQTLQARIVDSSGQPVLLSEVLNLRVNTPQGDLVDRVGLTASGIAQFNFLEAGQTLDLTQVSGVSQPRIDQINLTGLGFPNGGDNKVILSLDDVLQAGVGKFVEGSGFAGLVADGRKQLMVTGIPGGIVEVLDTNANVNDNWTAAGSVTDGTSGQTYLVYNSGSNAQLLIDTDLTRLGAVL